MENLTIKGNFEEPTVNFDSQKGLIEISGNSIPDRSVEFYIPIVEWVKKYAEAPASTTTINFNLIYYNSATKKFLLDLINIGAALHKAGKKVIFNWHYDEYDDEMEDSGIHYSELSGLPVNLIKKKTEGDDGFKI